MNSSCKKLKKIKNRPHLTLSKGEVFFYANFFFFLFKMVKNKQIKFNRILNIYI